MIHCLISTKITSINCKTSLVCYFITTKITKIICRTSLVQICVDIIHLFEQHTTTSDIDIPPGGGTLIPPKGGGREGGLTHAHYNFFLQFLHGKRPTPIYHPDEEGGNRSFPTFNQIAIFIETLKYKCHSSPSIYSCLFIWDN